MTDQTPGNISHESKFGDTKEDHIDLAHYTVMTNTWVASRMELDKSMLTLSTAAIGLLITLTLSYIGISAIFSVLAVAVFMSTIIIILKVFKMNADYLEHEIRCSGSEDAKILAGKLEGLDSWVSRLFISGIILSVFFAAAAFLSEASIINLELTVCLKTK